MENIEKMNTAKVTDAEIVKALDTPYNRKWVIADDGNGDFIRVGDIIDLVNRTQAKNKELKAEIEELKKDKYIIKDGVLELVPRTDIEEIKSEARKEFAERLKLNKAIHYCVCGRDTNTADMFNRHIDFTLKEMESDTE